MSSIRSTAQTARAIHASRQTSRTRQSGAIGLFAVLTIMMTMLFSVLAIDTGRLWLQKRQLQNAVDMAALSSARYTGCGTRNEEAVAAANAALQQSVLAANEVTHTTLRGYITRDANRRTVFNARNSELTNATQVTAQRTVPASLIMGGLFQETITLSATAVAEGGAPAATFSVNSFMGATEQQAEFITMIFKGILGNSSLNLTSDAFKELNKSTVNLLKLQSLAGAATIDELLQREVPLSDLLKWIGQGADQSITSKEALDKIFQASLNNGLKVKLGDVLSVQLPASAAVASVNINVLDLVQTSLMVGAEDSLIKLEVGGGLLTALGATKLYNFSLKMIDRPKLGIGPAGKWLNKPASAPSEWCTFAKSTGMELLVGIDVPVFASVGVKVSMSKVSGMLNTLSVQPGDIDGSIGLTSAALTFALTDAVGDGDAKFGSVPFFPNLAIAKVGIELPFFEATAKDGINSPGAEAVIDIKSNAELSKRLRTNGLAGSSVSGLFGPSTKIKIGLFGLPPFDAGKPLRDLIMGPLKIVGDLVITPFLSTMGVDAGLVKVTLDEVSSTPPKLRQ